VQSTDTIKVEFATTTYPNNWTDASNVVSLALDSTGDATKSAGFTVASGSATTTVVTFNRYKTLANDDAPAVDWANTMMWRVRKVSGGASVGYPISSANIVGRTDGVAPAAGMVGSTISCTTWDEGNMTNGVPKHIGTLPLPAGRWHVFGKVLVTNTGGCTVTDSSANINTGTVNFSTLMPSKVLTGHQYIMPAPLVVDSAGATTAYLDAGMAFSGGTSMNGNAGNSFFYAVRIA
jgi:hypothetical protein